MIRHPAIDAMPPWPFRHHQGSIPSVFVTQIAEVTQVTKIAEIAEVSWITQIAEVAWITQIAEVSWVTEIAKIAEVAWITQIAEVAWITQIAEVSWIGQISEITQIPEGINTKNGLSRSLTSPRRSCRVTVVQVGICLMSLLLSFFRCKLMSCKSGGRDECGDRQAIQYCQ